MRLKALTIKNFKGIDETGICIALAPITLLFGPNNIGKSTVLQALILAREAFHGVIPDKIEAKQHGIELGSFKDYVYKNDLSRVIYIQFRFTVTPEDCNIRNEFKIFDEINDLLKRTVKYVDVEISIQWHAELNQAEVSGYTMYVNGKKIAAIQQNSSDNAEEYHKSPSLYVYDIAPFISEINLEKLENMWSELSKSMPDANQIEESRVFFKSAQWKNFLKLYFESVPSVLSHVSNVNCFLKQLGMPKSFLTKDWIEEIYEKAFYTIEDDFPALSDSPDLVDSPDLIDIYKYILEEFPNDVEFITTVIKNNDNPHDIFKELINHFKDNLISLKCLCKYLYSTYPAFWDYYRRINNIDSELFWDTEAFILEEDFFRTIFSMPEDVRKEYCHKILIDDIIKSFPSSFKSKPRREEIEAVAKKRGLTSFFEGQGGAKRYYSIDDYIFYKSFLASNNRNHYENPDGSISIKRDLHSQVKYNYQLLRKELLYFHFPDSIGYSGVEEIDVNFLSLFSWPFEKIGAYLDSLLYVGPLRKIPERGSKGLWFYELDAATSKSDWSDGMAAWDWMATASEQALAELNSKLHGKGSMETGFAVKRRQFIRLEKGSDVFNALIHDPKTGREDPDHSPLRTLLELPPSEVQLSMVDLQTGLETEPYSMGTGVSQVLPIVAASVAANGKLVLLEQPELHIHPKLQTTLGDLFLSAVNKDSMFVLETHSEHLMLRLLRRIRETTEGELPNGTPSTSVDDVAVNYIQKNSNDCTEAIAIPITPDGDFARSWPNGFFAERAEELF